MATPEPTPEALRLGDYIRDVREARRPKMRQIDLAKIVGVSRTTITALERGTAGSPRVTVLAAIADALDRP